ncbi:DUF5301 domain-containing protein [Paenibacillus polymyxa]|uniref:DUF5301 domain-containing protein n=1 Tax=Paenibacillus polymyxa TaxID=1406 RepID=UPI002AB5D7A8|nr:DUF5301 domain-containing protein [Paenibacillus polymyxa]MDY8024457.1 DUF5301 domain-containing protein [Paenibacillus polymyxa]
MRRRNRYILKSAIILIAAIIGMMYIVNLDTTFRKVVLDRMDTARINTILISKSPDYTDQLVKDKNDIQSILNTLAEMKLRKSSILDKGLNSTYMLSIFVDHGNKRDLLGITLYDQNYIEIYDETKTKNKITSYKITNDYEMEPIRKLFK